MGRLPLVDSKDPNEDPRAREVLQRVSGERSSIEPNVYRAMANHPDALAAWAELARDVYFDNSLTPAQRELSYLTASVVNECHY